MIRWNHPGGHASGIAQLLEHLEIERLHVKWDCLWDAAEATELAVVLMARMDLTVVPVSHNCAWPPKHNPQPALSRVRYERYRHCNPEWSSGVAAENNVDRND